MPELPPEEKERKANDKAMEIVITQYMDTAGMAKGRPGPVAGEFVRIIVPLRQISKKVKEMVERTPIWVVMENYEAKECPIKEIAEKHEWTVKKRAHITKVAVLGMMMKRNAKRKAERRNTAEVDEMTENEATSVWDLLD